MFDAIQIYGGVAVVDLTNEKAVAAFWQRVQKSRRCWWWNGARSQGYGLFTFAGIARGAHRVAWALHNGPIPAGKCVCHHCDNPLCVRPDHLYVGSSQDNIRDASERGRLRGARTPPPPVVVRLGPLTARQVGVLRFIQDYHAKWGFMPTLTDIAGGLRLRSLATVHKHLATLEAKGKITRLWNHSRSITLTGACPICGHVAVHAEEASAA